MLVTAFCFGTAVWREIDTGAGQPHPEMRRLARILTENILLGLVPIAAFVGIWFG